MMSATTLAHNTKRIMVYTAPFPLDFSTCSSRKGPLFVSCTLHSESTINSSLILNFCLLHAQGQADSARHSDSGCTDNRSARKPLEAVASNVSQKAGAPRGLSISRLTEPSSWMKPGKLSCDRHQPCVAYNFVGLRNIIHREDTVVVTIVVFW